ncbi:LysR family transcriptional regulator [Noviherbaspirillum galbum]|uniref:LysR family transcriptional regulator n=1 Tax=Noviherbaspirillum galbum TaxID=2709383 RepID=A0A6B3SQF0_9BURK|nr:LysR family transcriptional regulator [Noviherbaspirillum galbum]NEX62987.1 LysR family transcriptional regulator [Noviherbaspirillum galbum]
MNLNDIDYLEAVAEHRSVGRAAEALGLSQPALTKAIARLEALAGMPLFERHPKGVMLTAAGEAFLLRAHRIRIEFDDAMREMHQMKTGELGLLRVGFSPSLDNDKVMSVIRRLLVERPAARLYLVEKLMQYLLEMLVEGDLDLVIAPSPRPAVADLEVIDLYDDNLYVIADLEHPLHRRTTLDLDDLGAQPWLLPARDTRLRTEMEALFQKAGLPALNVRVETTATTMNSARLICGTSMLGLGSAWSLEPLRRLGLGPLPVNLPALQRKIALLMRKHAYQSPLALRLSQLLTEELTPAETRLRKST